MTDEMTVKQMAALGGKARAAKLSKERQSQIGRQAINARWKKHRKAQKKKPTKREKS
jgi:hypothetical protein